MSLHYSSGKLLLKNITDNQWYYLEVRVDAQDGLPHLYPHQTIAGDYSLSDYDEYAVIRANNGLLFKLYLETNNSGQIDFALTDDFELEKLPSILFLKDTTTSFLYLLQLLENDQDGEVYPNLTNNFTGQTTTTVNSPFKCSAPVSVVDGKCITKAEPLTQETVIVPVGPTLPTHLAGSGTGEDIVGSGNEERIGSSH